MICRIKKIKKSYRKILRLKIDYNNRKRLKNKNFTIISSNCIGGVLYHELGLKFLSPTINMYLRPNEFIKFCQNMRYYLSCEPVYVEQSDFDYPVARLDDIYIFAVHYSDFLHFKTCWESRKKRCDFDNMFLMMSERDGCSLDDIKAFDMLPYNNKVVFVHESMPDIKSAVHIEGSELDGTDGQWIKALTSYEGRFTGRRYIDRFDYVDFFNKG